MAFTGLQGLAGIITAAKFNDLMRDNAQATTFGISDEARMDDPAIDAAVKLLEAGAVRFMVDSWQELGDRMRATVCAWAMRAEGESIPDAVIKRAALAQLGLDDRTRAFDGWLLIAADRRRSREEITALGDIVRSFMQGPSEWRLVFERAMNRVAPGTLLQDVASGAPIGVMQADGTVLLRGATETVVRPYVAASADTPFAIPADAELSVKAWGAGGGGGSSAAGGGGGGTFATETAEALMRQFLDRNAGAWPRVYPRFAYGPANGVTGWIGVDEAREATPELKPLERGAPGQRKIDLED